MPKCRLVNSGLRVSPIMMVLDTRYHVDDGVWGLNPDYLSPLGRAGRGPKP